MKMRPLTMSLCAEEREREEREKRERVAFFAASYAQATRFLRELALSSRLGLID